jgi:hypothetical protein
VKSQRRDQRLAAEIGSREISNRLAAEIGSLEISSRSGVAEASRDLKESICDRQKKINRRISSICGSRPAAEEKAEASASAEAAVAVAEAAEAAEAEAARRKPIISGCERSTGADALACVSGEI